MLSAEIENVNAPEPDADSTESEVAELDEAELSALLGAQTDPEAWGPSPQDSLHALDRENARAMLAARPAVERLAHALTRAASLAPAPPARLAHTTPAPLRPARADRNARRLLAELLDLRDRLHELPNEPPARLATADDRATALAMARRLSDARKVPAWATRMAGVRARLAAADRARARLAACVGRAADEVLVSAGGAGWEPSARRRALRPLGELVAWLREEEPATHAALLSRYAAVAAPDYERRIKAHTDNVANAKDDAAMSAALAQLVSFVESSCGAEEEFCRRFFRLDADKDGEGPGPDTRRALAALMPALEPALLAMLDRVAGADGLGAMRVLAAAGGRALEADAAGAGAQALAALALAAKRRADRCVSARAAALEEAARRARPAPLAQIQELEELADKVGAACAGGRRAEPERWLAALAGAVSRGLEAGSADDAGRLRGYHALHAALSSPALRAAALAEERRSARARYEAALSSLSNRLAGRALAGRLASVAEAAGRAARAAAGGGGAADVRLAAGWSRREVGAAVRGLDAAAMRVGVRAAWGEAARCVPEAGLRAVVWGGVQGVLAGAVSRLAGVLAECYAGLALPYGPDDVLRMCDEVAHEDD